MSNKEEQVYKEKVKQTVGKVYLTLSNHYIGTFYKGPDNMKKDHIATWMKGIYESKIDLNKLEEFTNFIIYQCAATQNKAPNISSFLSLFEEWTVIQATKSSADVLFDKEFNTMYTFFAVRYERLWARTDVCSVEMHRNFWREEILKSKIEPKTLSLAYEKTRKINAFKIFPPNIDQFIEISKIIEKNEDIPSTVEAFDTAISSQDASKMHPLIKLARSKFGYTSLINLNSSTKQLFENEYNLLLQKYINNKLDLKNHIAKEKPQTVEKFADSKKIGSAISNILENLKI